jgi:histidyl-tRNA synthetase
MFGRFGVSAFGAYTHRRMPSVPVPGRSTQHKFQAPKGTRDFYPQDMAVRRHIEGVWRQVSINHGFDEVEGPMFEHTELYTHKSGPGIVSEIFGVFSGKDEAELAALQKTGRAPYALRPEFTPTLARMVASKAAELPRPIKWFAIPQHFRAERPQRGRLREFMQWNVDFIGDDSPAADAEVIATAVAALEKLGMKPDNVRVRISNRAFLTAAMRQLSIAQEHETIFFDFLDKRDQLTAEEYSRRAWELGISKTNLEYIDQLLGVQMTGGFRVRNFEDHNLPAAEYERLAVLQDELVDSGVDAWCDFDLSIVRGLAYYTGTVFEIIADGERAVAGGGRYDKLIEGFGGPSLPACGFGMGDVVLGLLLQEKGLLKPEEAAPRPDAFIISSGVEVAEKALRPLIARLRRAGFHVRHSYKTTKNVGKLLGEAGKCRARFAVILDDALASNIVKLKDLDDGEQHEILLTGLEQTLRDKAAARANQRLP